MKRIAEGISKQENAVGAGFGRNPYGHGSFGPLTAFWFTNMEKPELEMKKLFFASRYFIFKELNKALTGKWV